MTREYSLVYMTREYSIVYMTREYSLEYMTGGLNNNDHQKVRELVLLNLNERINKIPTIKYSFIILIGKLICRHNVPTTIYTKWTDISIVILVMLMCL